jgi:RNA polymerase sigma-70 factor, ECF subfamily
MVDAVEKLSADYPEVFILRTLDHAPFDEVAPRVCQSMAGAGMLWARTRERLNAILEGQA